MKNEPLIKTIIRRIKKRVSGRTLLILIITLSANTFAWFVYSNIVSSGVEATVRAWNIRFEVDQGEITEYVTIDVDELYPGKTFSKSINITNGGDSAADLTYQIVSITKFGTQITYTAAQNQNPATLLSNIQSTLPFTITAGFSNTTVAAGSSETFDFGINWPYESGNDTRDTQWGSDAYTYSNTHPGSPHFQMEFKISAVQSVAPAPTPEPEPEP